MTGDKVNLLIGRSVDSLLLLLFYFLFLLTDSCSFATVVADSGLLKMPGPNLPEPDRFFLVNLVRPDYFYR